MNTKKTLALALTAALGCSLAGLAQADKLDDIIESGKLRCAVTLDFPPMGSRDAQNNPVGFDVDYCRPWTSRRRSSRRPFPTASRRWCRVAPT